MKMTEVELGLYVQVDGDSICIVTATDRKNELVWVCPKQVFWDVQDGKRPTSDWRSRPPLPPGRLEAWKTPILGMKAKSNLPVGQ